MRCPILQGVALALACAIPLTPAAGQAPPAQPRLGTIDFPATGSPAAQPAFLRGVLFLHSFEYASAIRSFRAAQAADSGFVLAYWGEALSFTHPVWNQQDLDSARWALAKLAPSREARLARAATARERAYLAAVEDLYGEGSKQRRDTLFARAMLRMVDEYPGDLEAKAFASLALLGLNQGVRDYATYMRAAALAEQVFRANPDHPGAAHYIIHSFDDPIHAPLGLDAARAYSRIAPDAAHAQHMTTHVFLALGMWDDVVSQNVIAANLTAWVPMHYTEWLHYGELQQGRYRDAGRLMERLRGQPGALNRRQRAEMAFMRAQHVVATEDWSSALWEWPLDPSALPLPVVQDQFVRGLAAARRGDAPAAGAAHVALLQGMDSIRARGDSLMLRAAMVMERELAAIVVQAEGGGDSAVSLLNAATAIEDRLPMDFGPPLIVKPSHELLGETLLELHRPAEAQREFVRALDLAPGRARSLIGLVRAAAAAGDRAVAESAFHKLQANWHDADPDRPELRALRPLVAMN